MRAYQNLEVTGSINVTGSITANDMTASFFHGTASYASTASFLSGSGDLSGSVTGSMTGSLTGSVSGTLIGSVTGTLVGGGTGSFTGSFFGQFSGSGANLYDISASSIIGLDLSRIGSGSVTASADAMTGFTVKSEESGSAFSGSVNITGSLVVSGALTVVGADGSSLQIDVPSDPTTGSMFTVVGSDNSPIFEVFANKTARISGSLTVTGGTTGSFTGSFFGEFSSSGANLYDISASSIIGLNLARVSTGSVSASAYIEDGTGSFHITNNTYITGSFAVEGSALFNNGVTGSSFTGSFTGSFNGVFEGTASYAANAAAMDGGIY